jgi:hypothetical protein
MISDGSPRGDGAVRMRGGTGSKSDATPTIWPRCGSFLLSARTGAEAGL